MISTPLEKFATYCHLVLPSSSRNGANISAWAKVVGNKSSKAKQYRNMMQKVSGCKKRERRVTQGQHYNESGWSRDTPDLTGHVTTGQIGLSDYQAPTT